MKKLKREEKGRKEEKKGEKEKNSSKRPLYIYTPGFY